MSIIYCNQCDKHIDTDEDTEHEHFCAECGEQGYYEEEKRITDCNEPLCTYCWEDYKKK